ncbi:S-methyl-5-thioribose kinase [Alkalihalobacillus pseudalcaliphilus]|uniref:S-methyl-5-thioribose kinase n=1 Tax=Alkalihalobacillus pseudalcaliphilus TaxID=79884 RepID=UPI00064DDA51|nr:S-methyl-5-thioribose kinase [Alkalihalobacillus pseudalcaliphilus]KMK76085.1 methylthioribose kinase [Alkalihalobacillus pseudalcaliphilus]
MSIQYIALTEATAVNFLKEIGLLNEDERATVSEIGDGNLNYVFNIFSQTTGRSFIVKQALPYAKVVGESWPLTLDRARIEASVLQLAAKYVPNLVPKVFHHDQTLALTVMENLSDFTILREGLITGNLYPQVASHIGIYLAEILFRTSTFHLHPKEAKELAVDFINPDLCDITERLVFTDPFFDSETNSFDDHLKPLVHELWSDNKLKREVAKLKHLFLTKSEALIHGDIHTGSIFVTKDETKIIDPEFAFYGPKAFDIGTFFANLIMNYYAQEGQASNSIEKEQQQSYLIQTLIDTWKVFETTYTELWKNESKESFTKVDGHLEDVLATIWTESVGFAGAEMIRRMIGLAHVKDVDSIQELAIRQSVQQTIIQVARTFITERHSIKDMDSLIQQVKVVYV